MERIAELTAIAINFERRFMTKKLHLACWDHRLFRPEFPRNETNVTKFEICSPLCKDALASEAPL